MAKGRSRSSTGALGWDKKTATFSHQVSSAVTDKTPADRWVQGHWMCSEFTETSYSRRMLQRLSAKWNWLGVQWSEGKTVAVIVLLEPEIGRCSELLDISSKNSLFYFIRPARTETIAVRSPFWNISLAPTSEQVLSLHHPLKWCEVYRDWSTRTCTFIVWTQVNAVIIASLRHFSVPIGGEKTPFVFSYGGRSTVGTSSQGVPWTVWVEARWSVLVTLMWDILKILVWEKVHEAKKKMWNRI